VSSAGSSVTADRYAVIGNPVAHSRSPVIHAAFAAQTDQPVQYGLIESPADGFAQTVRHFAAGGGRGCNVTVPFKFEAFALCRRSTPRARRAGAANTLRFDAEGWWADNTDGIGLVRDIEINAGFALAGRRLLLLGAGGAAAGVLGPLIESRPAEIVIANRTMARAQALVERHADWAYAHGVRLVSRPLDAPGAGFEVLINASASSLGGGAASPVAADTMAESTPAEPALAVDLMYGASARPFVRWAREHGAVGRDGLGMLVEQAAEAFFAWRGVRPQTAPVLTMLREQADGEAG
jgi:shikimate dehydrogenase